MSHVYCFCYFCMRLCLHSVSTDFYILMVLDITLSSKQEFTVLLSSYIGSYVEYLVSVLLGWYRPVVLIHSTKSYGHTIYLFSFIILLKPDTLKS